MESIICRSTPGAVWRYEPIKSSENASADEVISSLYSMAPDKQFGFVVANFDVLNQPDAARDSAELPARLQEAFVILIMGQKASHDLSITFDDIIKLFKQLQEKLPNYVGAEGEQQTEKILSCLSKGVVRFNRNVEHKVSISTMEFSDFSAEVEFQQISRLSQKDQIILAQASQARHERFLGFYESRIKLEDEEVIEHFKQGKTAYQIYQEFPQCRKDRFVPCGPQGIAYLTTLGLGGPLLNREIRNGTLTIAQALAHRDAMYKDLLSKLPTFPEEVQRYLNMCEAQGIVKYIVDGTLALESALRLAWGQKMALENSGVQLCIDHEILSIDEASNLPEVSLYFLNEKAIQEYILDGSLTKEEVLNLSKNARNLSVDNLYWKGIKTCIKEKVISVQEAMSLEMEAIHALCSNVVMGYVQRGLLSITKLKTLGIYEITALLSKGVQKYIDNGNGPLTLEQALEYSVISKTASSSILSIPEFQQAIAIGEMTIQECVRLSYDKVVDFIAQKRADSSDAAAQKYLMQGMLTQEQFDGLTEHQKANLNTAGVQQLIDNGALKMEDAVELTVGFRLFFNIPLILEAFLLKRRSVEKCLHSNLSSKQLVKNYLSDYEGPSFR